MKPIVGFVGYARSGKDTAAQVLLDNGWKRMAFADQLKLDVERIVGCPLAGPGANPVDKEFWRPLLVEYGRLRRKQHPDYWVWQVEANLRMTAAPGDRVVLTDVRYKNECEWILNRGGILIYVERPGVGPANSEEAESIAEILGTPYAVERMSLALNNSSVEVLHGDVRGMVKWRLGKI